MLRIKLGVMDEHFPKAAQTKEMPSRSVRGFVRPCTFGLGRLQSCLRDSGCSEEPGAGAQISGPDRAPGDQGTQGEAEEQGGSPARGSSRSERIYSPA